MKRVFSGIQPTGPLHIGNYVGAIKQWVELQKEHECVFCIVDWHAITVPYNPEELRKSIYEKARIYLAAGIDPNKSIIFVQSDVPEHTELQWLLSTITPMGELNRMTQYKDKKDKGSNLGLFAYPVLMAADILLYNTDIVPVGEDQQQHVELSRFITRRFNTTFQTSLKTPESYLPKKGARILSLTDPSKKMSKSDPDMSRINLTDPPEMIIKKIKRAVTDNDNEIRYDPKNKPGLSNLLTIYSAFSDQEASFNSYAELKENLANLLIEKLEPFRNNQIDPTEILEDGARKARLLAQENMTKIREKMGFDRNKKKC